MKVTKLTKSDTGQLLHPLQYLNSKSHCLALTNSASIGGFRISGDKKELPAPHSQLRIKCGPVWSKKMFNSMLYETSSKFKVTFKVCLIHNVTISLRNLQIKAMA